MKNEIIINEEIEVNELFYDIKSLIEQCRNRVYRAVNTEMINLYWNIGKMIVDMQEGNDKAKYGDHLIDNISIRLSSEFGKGFSTRNIKRMRKFYQCYPIGTTMLSQLTWSHYLQLIKIEDEKKNLELL